MAETTPRKNNAPSNAILIAAVAMGLIGIAVINSINYRLSPQELERQAKEREQKMAEAAAQAQSQASPGAPAPQPVSGPSNELAAYGEEKIIGDPNAKTEVTFAYEWTPEVQADPGKVLKAVEAAKTVAPNAKIRVVNIDARPDEGLTPGVYVNGQMRMPQQPDGAFVAEPQAYAGMVGSGPPGPATAPSSPAAPAAAPSPAAKPAVP